MQFDRLRYQMMLALNGVFAKTDAMLGPFDTGPMPIASSFTAHPCLRLHAGLMKAPTRSPGSLSVVATEPSYGPRFRAPQGISLLAGLFDEGTRLRVGMALAVAVVGERPIFPR